MKNSTEKTKSKFHSLFTKLPICFLKCQTTLAHVVAD
jgi:hypothetical protein